LVKIFLSFDFNHYIDLLQINICYQKVEYYIAVKIIDKQKSTVDISM